MPAGAHRNQQKKIDSNNIATVFRKGNAITKLLTDAIQKENADNWTDVGKLPNGNGMTSTASAFENNISDLEQNVNEKFSMKEDSDFEYDEDSNLTREQQRQVATPEFKRWFGDSKVVDEDGKPLVVYHGTGDDFTVFDPWKTNYGDVSEGYSFFTNKKNGYADSAQDYANRHKNGHVMETYLKIEKPLRLKSDGYFTPVH